jgi:hypothetical protein
MLWPAVFGRPHAHFEVQLSSARSLIPQGGTVRYLSDSCLTSVSLYSFVQEPVPLSPLSEGDVRLLFRNSSRLESRNSPLWEVLTVPRQDLGCRSFGEPVLCKTNTRSSCLKNTPWCARDTAIESRKWWKRRQKSASNSCDRAIGVAR